MLKFEQARNFRCGTIINVLVGSHQGYIRMAHLSEIISREQRAPQTNDHGHIRSRVVRRSLAVGGHKTSVSLEDAFWNELRAIARERHVPLSQLVGDIDGEREHCNLSSATRVFVYEQRCCKKSGNGF